jgi:hypothetical protein
VLVERVLCNLKRLKDTRLLSQGPQGHNLTGVTPALDVARTLASKSTTCCNIGIGVIGRKVPCHIWTDAGSRNATPPTTPLATQCRQRRQRSGNSRTQNASKGQGRMPSPDT